ncbi:MAG: zinc ribbon domain-containing protein [Ruminococcus sp.]|nr:zinc ribbon domain-containing protein [Ruminococcus sp.]
MRCKYCGAEIKEGSSVCEYCGSAAEKQTSQSHTASGNGHDTVKSITRTAGKVIIALACIWAVLIAVTLIITLNSDVFNTVYEYTENRYAGNEGSGGGYSADEMPRNKSGLLGQIISCDEKGLATVEYDGQHYSNVKITDKDLIEWVNDTERSLDTVGICFATDADGNINELGLLSPDFFVMDKDGDRYTAIRDGDVIAFTSSIAIEAGRFYGGYFSYPDLCLYQKTEQSPFSLSRMDPACTGKERVTMQDYYTGEDVAVYRLCIGDDWYYCSREAYDAVLIGALPDGYQICEESGLAFIMED